MGIYIEDMEMPSKENAVILITPSGDVWMIGDMPNEDTHLVKAKAVPVPPHGRLIDADARANVQMYYDEFEDYQTVNMSIDDLLDSSWIELEDDPTIIPAEEG